MSSLWETTDFGATVRDFEFTRKAARQIGAVVYSAAFEDMDSDTIFQYLMRGMELVSFKDYLKRYLYERAQIDIPFREVTDDVYRQIIMDSFKENAAPHSFEPVTKKWSVIVKRWLTQDSVRRQTIFLLGFGLRMKPEDVSEFLTKVLKEEDFRLSDPEELIYRYCFANDLRYSSAQELLKKYEALSAQSGENTLEAAKRSQKQGGLFQKLLERRENKRKEPAGFGKNGQEDGQERITVNSEEDLMRVLSQIHRDRQEENRDDAAYIQCMGLSDRVKQIIAGIYQKDEEEKGTGKIWTARDISSADMEKIICSGIPVNSSGNLQKMSASLLNSHFRQRRFSRQRMDSLEKRTLPVERFDLITLLFFIYSQEWEDEEPELRCRAYIDEMNDILRTCGMIELYPVNPYEAFILMCLLAECPLAVYSDIWEMSYTEEPEQ